MILKYGDKNAEVLAVQQALRNLGYGLECDGIFGRNTRDTVKHYQSVHGLKQTGIVDDVTWNKLLGGRDAEAEAGDAQSPAKDAPTPPIFIEMLVKVAQSYVGIRETSENKGKHITQWLKECGINYPAPWCMAYVQGCFAETAKRFGTPDPLKPDTAGVLDLWNRTDKAKRVSAVYGRRGDIMIADYGKGKGHTGIVIGIAGSDYIVLEGNTNDAGSREGDCVAVKRRAKNWAKLKGFVRVMG